MTAEKLRLQEDLGRRSRITLKVLDKVFEDLEAECFEAFRSSAPEDDEGRKNCNLYLRVMDDVKDRLERATIAGENARKELIKTTVKVEETHVRNTSRNPT